MIYLACSANKYGEHSDGKGTLVCSVQKTFNGSSSSASLLDKRLGHNATHPLHGVLSHVNCAPTKYPLLLAEIGGVRG